DGRATADLRARFRPATMESLLRPARGTIPVMAEDSALRAVAGGDIWSVAERVSQTPGGIVVPELSEHEHVDYPELVDQLRVTLDTGPNRPVDVRVALGVLVHDLGDSRLIGD